MLLKSSFSVQHHGLMVGCAEWAGLCQISLRNTVDQGGDDMTVRERQTDRKIE